MSASKLLPLLGGLMIIAATPILASEQAPAPSAREGNGSPSPVAPVQVASAQNVVRIAVTAQASDFLRPWSRRPPVTRRAIGAVLPGQRVLVSAECVANSNYIEFESPNGENKQPALIECVDYEANLALLRPESGDFLKDQPGIELTNARVGDSLSIWQLEANGNLLVTKGLMTTAEVARYAIDESSFLLFRVSVPLQIRDASVSLPVLKDGKLAGIMMRYDAASSLMDLIPTAVVQHFLKDAESRSYRGFPRMGCGFSNTRDPQLRRYLGLQGANGGVLIGQLLRGGPAEKAGLKKGDVLLEIDGRPVDSDGNYADPEFGRIALGHLVSTKHFEGDKVKTRVLREGKILEIDVYPARRRPEQYLSEPYVLDRAPRFFILGGLVLQELSRQFLKDFGSDWNRKAPSELLHLDRTQAEQPEDGTQRIVFLNRVLPSDVTVGYEDLHFMVVKSINGVPLRSLQDVPAALLRAENGLHRIDFASDPTRIYLDAKSAEAIGPELLKAYGIPKLSHLE